MTDTVNVPREVIERAVVMAKAIMKAEPLYGCVGYHGDEQINGHVEEAADLACLVMDEMTDPVTAPNDLAAAPKAEPVSATASDELLETLREVTPELTAEFANIDGPWCRGQMNVDDVWSRLIAAQIEAIAQHKGPQS